MIIVKGFTMVNNFLTSIHRIFSSYSSSSYDEIGSTFPCCEETETPKEEDFGMKKDICQLTNCHTEPATLKNPSEVARAHRGLSPRSLTRSG